MKEKIILVDAWNALFTEGGVDEKMKEILDIFPNKKIVLTGANDEQILKFGIDKSPYEFFTLKHNPEKYDAKYFEIFLVEYNLKPADVVYFEHNIDAVNSARQNNITTLHFDKDIRDLNEVKEFLENNI